MSDRTIRLATLDDVDALRELIAVSARGLNLGDYTAAQVESILRSVYGVDTQLLHDGTYYAVEADGTIIGCGGWSKRKTLYGGDQHKTSAEDNLLDPATDAARIRAFFVHPDWARQGVGSLLMTTCETAARQAGFQKMELMATLTGEYLYTRFSFVAVETVDVPLPDGEVMRVRRMTKAIEPTG
ncbi:MAG TPA: GNAT family N-acetyltransferase [Candidatus Limnocylindrales bacterium]|nr:GNAT family N-acetyltransferase [Candidatus Limnocylindrales bacterium]